MQLIVKNPMMKIKFTKNKSLVVSLALLFLIIGSQTIMAQATPSAVPAKGVAGFLGNLFSINNIFSAAITFPAMVIGYIAGFIASIVFSVGGWLIQIAFNMNDNLLSPGSPVLVGWQEVLTFANLGFVLAIIIIAFATIFRVQSYAMKQTLWKLIVAALLVNFSLVIAGAFINVADILGKHFLREAKLGGQGWFAFSDTLAGLFRAQAFFKFADLTEGFDRGVLEEAAGMANAASAGVLTNVASIFFAAFFTLISALTLLAIAVMLFIRYIYLGVLLIIVPIVWLAWIFPATAGWWKQWWEKFFRWTFFAPIMLFFLSLTVKTMQGVSNQPSEYLAGIINNSNVQKAEGIKLTFGLDVIGNILIIFALLMGGLFAANSLSITFASTAYGWAEARGKAFGGWAGRKGTQIGTLPLRRKWGDPGKEKSLAERTQEWAASRKTKLGRFAAGWVSQGTSKLSAIGGENLIKQEDGRIKDMTLLQKKAALLTAGAPTRISLLKSLAESKDLDGVDMTRYLAKKQKDEFHRFGQGVAFSNIEKTVGKSVEMLEAASSKDADALRKATDKFVKGLKQADLAKGQWNDIFAEEPAFKLDKETHGILANDLAAAFAEYMPGAFAKIGPQIKGKNMDSYKETVNYQISMLEKEKPDVAKKARDSFEKNMGWLSLGLGAEELKKE